MKRLITGFALFAQATLAIPVAAQSVPSALGLAIGVTEEAAACGITEETVRAAIRAAMRYNRIEEVTEFTPHLINVIVNGGYYNGSCQASVNVRVTQTTLATPQGMDAEVVAQIIFCEQGGLLGGPNLGSRANDTLRHYFDACLSEIQNNTLRG